MPFRRTRPLVAIVTSFTVAHSVTLIAAAYDLGPDALWFPPLVETLIATSILYMALENIVAGVGVTRRWLVAFGFGLVHGLAYLVRASADASICRVPSVDVGVSPSTSA
jgi:putative exporter of polyketide antibiotics